MSWGTAPIPFLVDNSSDTKHTTFGVLSSYPRCKTFSLASIPDVYSHRTAAFSILALTFIEEGPGANRVAAIRDQVFELQPTDSEAAVRAVIQEVIGAPIEERRVWGNSILTWLSDPYTCNQVAWTFKNIVTSRLLIVDRSYLRPLAPLVGEAATTKVLQARSDSPPFNRESRTKRDRKRCIQKCRD